MVRAGPEPERTCDLTQGGDLGDVHTQRTQLEGGPLQAKKTGLSTNEICQPLTLGLPGSRTVRNKFLNSKLSSPWYFVTAALKADTGRFYEFPRINKVLSDPTTKYFHHFNITDIKKKK